MSNNTQITAANGEGGKGLPEWQKDRIEMALDIQKHILTPIMDFSFLMENKYSIVDEKDCAAILRLLVMGSYADLKIYCVWNGGGHIPLVGSDDMENFDKSWREALAAFQAEKDTEE